MARNTQSKDVVGALLETAALEKIKAQFVPARWDKITRQALNSCALDAAGLKGLCTRLLAARAARHPDNDAAALYAACNGLLLAIGSSLNEHDCSRFEEALKTGKLSPLPVEVSAPAPAPVDADTPAPAETPTSEPEPVDAV